MSLPSQPSANLSRTYAAVVIGASAGGSAALARILAALPADYALPLVVVQHLHPWQAGPALLYTARHQAVSLTVREAEEKETAGAGVVYFAPANYHLLMENDGSFSLTTDEKVNYTRPSIDVLFESAADTYGARLIGVILSGANQDGAAGLCAVKRLGGLTVVQDPAGAEVGYMPRAAIEAAAACNAPVDYVLPLDEIGPLLCKLGAG